MKSRAVVLLSFNDNKILTISRRDNHNDFGLIGGKVDDTDASDSEAIKRETFEECGLEAFGLELIGKFKDIAVFYCPLVKGEIRQTDEGIVKYSTWNEIFNGTYHVENKAIFEMFVQFVIEKLTTFLDTFAKKSSDIETYGLYNSPDINELETIRQMLVSGVIPKDKYVGSALHSGLDVSGTMYFTRLCKMLNSLILSYNNQ